MNLKYKLQSVHYYNVQTAAAEFLQLQQRCETCVFIYTEGEGGSPVKGWTSESRVM